MSYKRRGMSRGKSRHDFRSKSATHPKNMAMPMRGGIRL